MFDLQESATAKLCSFARTFHSNFERNKILDDYLAYDMMGKEQYEKIGQLIENQYRPELFDPDREFEKERKRQSEYEDFCELYRQPRQTAKGHLYFHDGGPLMIYARKSQAT